MLLKQQGRRLSIASVGNFLVYKVNPRRTELLFGKEWNTNRWAVINPDLFFEPTIQAGQDEMPEIYSWEAELKPHDIIIIGTPSVPILQAKLEQLIHGEKYNLEKIDQHLTTTSKSLFRSSGYLEQHSISWVVTCIE